MQNYSYITSTISEELSLVDFEIQNILKSFDIRNNKHLNSIFDNSKKIRSVVTISALKMLFEKVTQNQIKICALTELIHNASLIHDDIIDDSDIRRNKPSLKKLTGNKQAVVLGDFILALCMKELSGLNNSNIIQIFADTMLKMCKGELFQLENKDKIPLAEYIIKSENKTAELFKASLTAAFLIEDNSKYIKFGECFGKNFGIAFQIRNDIDDIFKKTKNGKCFEDIKNNIYTAPVIFALQNNKKLTIKEIRNKEILEKSNRLCADFCDKALDLLHNFKDNQYKKNLIFLCELLKQDNKNEF